MAFLNKENTEPLRSLEEFLTTCPPNKSIEITFSARRYHGTYGLLNYLSLPNIELHCDHEKCNGIRLYECTNRDISVELGSTNSYFISYRCKNCESTVRLFAIIIQYDTVSTGKAIKLGERPPFGPHLSSKVISLIGPDRELFLSGWRAENQGMGIGAFAYYRRVVENQKNRILDGIIKVAEKLKTPSSTIDSLIHAKEITQFSKSVEEIKGALPDILLIDGHNPLTLLHNALSGGLHELPDDKCLELARAIRLLLTELADRISQVLKDHAELSSALSQLLNKNKS
jgi:hypothetical protein